ncbi:uncharacterized protein LOC107313007 isoform X1 [Coturnix japonica]|nr:uncharacterized protein LOC107313007 isoform X1 [Coturnix japonica]
MATGPAERGWRRWGEPGSAEMEPRPRSLACSSQMEASLTCAVCLSLFEEPVTLPLCSHNFCRGCVLECLASAEAARLQQQQQQRGQGQVRGARGGPGQGADGDDAAVSRVSCPLCRKLCPLPRGGAAALPVNTTLAEVVRLYRSNATRDGSSCQKHPGRLLQLYCRMCRQAGCGQCVSEEHQGVFHSINLIDTVYQEEQLNFFSSLKEMRIINEKLMNEISSPADDAETVLNNEAEVIALAFGEISKTLEIKKQQLTEDLENQRRKKEKEIQIWKKMKETHKKTIENLLNDCEKLVHECDPQHFLEVACGLNTRMKTQLDLMSIASCYKKPPEYTQKTMDIKPVVNEILALKLVPVNVDINKDLPSGGNENTTENTIKQGQDQKNMPNSFLPVAGQEESLTDSGRICTRLMSVSEMPVFQNLSHEELRYKYYMEHQKLNNFKIQTVPASKKYEFVAAEALKSKSSGIPLVSSTTKANSVDRVKVETLSREGGIDKTSFPGTSNHCIPSTSTKLSETNGDLSLAHERSSEEATTPALPENSKDQEIKENLPKPSAITVSNEMDTKSSVSLGLKPAASVAVTVPNSNLDFSASGAFSNSLPRFIKDAATCSLKDGKYSFPKFYLGKCDCEGKADNQCENKFRKCSSVAKTRVSDASTTCNLESVGSQKPVYSFSYGSSERECLAASEVSDSFKTLSLRSFFNQSEKTPDLNVLSHMGKNTSLKKTVDGTLKPSVAWEQNTNASESITTVPSGTSETTTAAGVNVISESSLLPSSCVFSFKNNSFQLHPNEIAGEDIVKNTSDSLTSSSVLLSRNGTDKTEKEKMKSLGKAPLNLGNSAYPVCAEPASRLSHQKCEGSSLCMNLSKNIGSADVLANINSSCTRPLCSAVLPINNGNAFCTQLTPTKQEIKIKHQENEITAESNYSCPRRKEEFESVPFQNTACSPEACSDLPSVGSVNDTREMSSDSDSDTEKLSQTSVSSDTSSASEYFSFTEDKVSARRKSET